MLHLPSLLLVDGDLELSRKVASTLERAGVAATTVASGGEACDALEQAPFDLILSELELPDMSAVGLLRLLRRSSIEVPFGGIGGAPDLDTIVQLMRHGAVDYLPKPLRMDAVVDAMDRAAQLARRSADLRSGAPFGAVASSMNSSSSISMDSSGWSSSPSMSNPSGGGLGGEPYPHPAAAAPLQDPRHRSPGGHFPPRGARSPASHPGRPMPAARGRHDAPPPRGHGREEPEQFEPVIKRISRLLKNGELELPAIAPIAGQVQQLMANPDAEVDDIVSLLGSDPSVTAGVLRLANSGRFGTSRVVTELREAVVRVGNKRALALAQQVVLSTLYTIEAAPLAGMMPAMWRNTVVTANGAREIANLLNMDDAEAEFVAGILHNVGELALLRILSEMPDRLKPGQAGLAEVSDLLAGAHEDFGRAVLKRWKMPARFIRVAGAHHRAPVGPEDRVARHRRELVLLAWSMAIECGFRYLPNQEPADIGYLCKELGLMVSELEDIYAHAKEW